METIGRTRREHLVQGKSIKKIALKLWRNAARKVRRSAASPTEGLIPAFLVRQGARRRPSCWPCRGGPKSEKLIFEQFLYKNQKLRYICLIAGSKPRLAKRAGNVLEERGEKFYLDSP